jgi:hypothetical protein
MDPEMLKGIHDLTAPRGIHPQHIIEIVKLLPNLTTFTFTDLGSAGEGCEKLRTMEFLMHVPNLHTLRMGGLEIQKEENVEWLRSIDPKTLPPIKELLIRSRYAEDVLTTFVGCPVAHLTLTRLTSPITFTTLEQFQLQTLVVGIPFYTESLESLSPALKKLMDLTYFGFHYGGSRSTEELAHLQSKFDPSKIKIERLESFLPILYEDPFYFHSSIRITWNKNHCGRI